MRAPQWLTWNARISSGPTAAIMIKSSPDRPEADLQIFGLPVYFNVDEIPALATAARN